MFLTSFIRPLILFLITILGGGCDWLFLVANETPESHYATYEEVVHSGSIERGWVPGFLPRSAQQIREVHSIDTSETRLMFAFAQEDLASLRSACVPTMPSAVRFPKGQGSTWWPPSLQETLTSASQIWSFYQCEEKAPQEGLRAYLAIAQSGTTACFWRTWRTED